MMKVFGLAALTLAVLASAGCAENPGRLASGRLTNQIAEGRAPSFSPKARAVTGRDGQDAARSCSNENPNIEYRDCVNALTRDPNAKIRLG